MNIPKLIGGILLVSALALLTSGSIKLYQALRIASQGVEVQATVDKLWKKRGGPGRQDEHWTEVAFKDESGQPHARELLLTQRFYAGLKRGDAVQVKYVPGRPETAELAATAGGLRPALIPLVGGVTFLGIALFLFLGMAGGSKESKE